MPCKRLTIRAVGDNSLARATSDPGDDRLRQDLATLSVFIDATVEHLV